MIQITVIEELTKAHRPLTSAELTSRVDDKNRRNIFKEIKRLIETKQILKIEIKLENEKCVILYSLRKTSHYNILININQKDIGITEEKIY